MAGLPKTLLQAIEVRGILEVESIALAAERATPDDLAKLEGLLRHMEKRTHEADDPLCVAPDFHVAIAEATHNQVLVTMVKSFAGLLTTGAQVISKRVPHAKDREYTLHAELYKPILRHDPEGARRAMRSHLEEAKRLVLEGFPGLDEEQRKASIKV